MFTIGVQYNRDLPFQQWGQGFLPTQTGDSQRLARPGKHRSCLGPPPGLHIALMSTCGPNTEQALGGSMKPSQPARASWCQVQTQAAELQTSPCLGLFTANSERRVHHSAPLPCLRELPQMGTSHICPLQTAANDPLGLPRT